MGAEHRTERVLTVDLSEHPRIITGSGHIPWRGAVGRDNGFTYMDSIDSGSYLIHNPGTYRAINEVARGVIVAVDENGTVQAAAEGALLWPMRSGWAFRTADADEYGDVHAGDKGLTVQHAGPWVPPPA